MYHLLLFQSLCQSVNSYTEDAKNRSGATVKMYEGGDWMTVGEASFSDDEVEYISF